MGNYPKSLQVIVRQAIPARRLAGRRVNRNSSRAQAGIAQEKIGEICSGRLKTSRTSGGKAAKNICEKLV
jgi:hypothetical protein